MGEREPNLQSFIKARAKNQVEDAKLRRNLAQLEAGRRLSKTLINSELFEDRKAAFELKQEARKVEQCRQREERRARRLVTVLAGAEGSTEGGSLGEGGGDKLSLAKLSTYSPHKTLSSARGATSDPLPASAARLTDAVDAVDKEEPFSTDASGLVLPTIRHKRSRSDSRGEGHKGELWLGKPEAIGSVRRPRKKPEEMLAVFKSGEDARRLVRESSRSCSRQCNKPDYLMELERMYEQLPDLEPAIRVAREVLSARSCSDGKEAKDKDKESDKEDDDSRGKVSLPPAPRSAGARPSTRDSSFKMTASARDSARMRLAVKVSQVLMEDLAKEKEDQQKRPGQQQQQQKFPPAAASSGAAAAPKLNVPTNSARVPAIASARSAVQSARGKSCRKPTPFKFPRNSILREMPA